MQILQISGTVWDGLMNTILLKELPSAGHSKSAIAVQLLFSSVLQTIQSCAVDGGGVMPEETTPIRMDMSFILICSDSFLLRQKLTQTQRRAQNILAHISHYITWNMIAFILCDMIRPYCFTVTASLISALHQTTGTSLTLPLSKLLKVSRLF